MIKIIKDLDITALGVSVFNRKWQPVHLQQGEMDGACAVYSMMMNLLILKVLTRNQVVNLNTTFKGNTAKGRLFKEFFVTEGLCRDGFYFSEIKEKLSHSFAKEVTSSALQYTASLSDQTSFVEELRTAIDSDTPLITALSFKGGAHAVLAIGYEEQKDVVKKIFCLDPSYAISPTSFWNGVIILNEGEGKYSHQYITDKDEDYINVCESLNIKKNNDMSEELQQNLRNQLWEVANKLRGNMSASDFMYFTLGFIFYKYLSEKIEKHANDALVDDEVTFKELWAMEKDADVEELQEGVKTECLENIGYFIEPNFLFSSVIESIKRKENILPMLERSLKRIEDSTLGQDSEEDFGGLFSDIDLASPKLGKTADDKNTLVSNVLLALDDIDFGVEASQEIDILGDAYEYMISQFAAGAGKKAGEFYTPQEVSRILAEIVTIGHARLRNVYDPTCGSGSLLLRAASIGHANEIFGQEKNPTTYNLARMNMLLHGIKFSNFRIENGDTLEADAFGDTQFDAVVANPPFSAEWSAADKFNNDDRFSKAGRLAPRKTADYAFILHMIYHLNEGGTMACVAPHGVLFRGNAEGVIRRFLIEKKNYVDAIIGLPANIFYGTSIPTCILVFKKCRKEDDNILFIDASKEFEKVKTQNKLRPQHIKKIVDTYRERKEIEKYSHLATLQEVAENDYNLNIPRYVDTFEEEEPIDIHAVMKEIKELEAKRADLDKEIEGYLKELGLVE